MHNWQLPAMPRLAMSEITQVRPRATRSCKRQKGICCVTNNENHIRDKMNSTLNISEAVNSSFTSKRIR
jgi:hypothetical protein